MKLADFIRELKKLNIEIDDEIIKKLEIYYELLVEQNELYNLTAITKKEDVYLKHFYDSLTLVKVIDFSKSFSLCDVGTGAGFPGLVLKILFPNLSVTLVDSLNKRVSFLNMVIKKLELRNIKTIHSRIEDYALDNEELFDIVTSRAVANLGILLEISMRLVKVDGKFIAMKGKLEEELSNTRNCLRILDSSIEKVENFKLPIEKSERNLVVIRKNKKTNKHYPRNFKEIKKSPL